MCVCVSGCVCACVVNWSGIAAWLTRRNVPLVSHNSVERNASVTFPEAPLHLHATRRVVMWALLSILHLAGCATTENTQLKLYFQFGRASVGLRKYRNNPAWNLPLRGWIWGGKERKCVHCKCCQTREKWSTLDTLSAHLIWLQVRQVLFGGSCHGRYREPCE